MMTQEMFSQATKGYLNRGWIIKSASTEVTSDQKLNVTIEFEQWSDTNMLIKTLELSRLNGVRIKGTDTNWNFTTWHDYTSLTAFL